MIIVNANCINLISEFEGLSLKAYHGAADKPGIDTIGYGSIRYPDGRKVRVGDPDITMDQATEFLKYEVLKTAKEIDVLLRDDLAGNQFAALISFAYNLGATALKNSTLRKKVNANPNHKAIRNEFLKWNIANGKVVKGLTRRRIAEADLYFLR